MGCSIVSKSKSKPRDKKYEAQAIRPSAFIIENKGRFQEVYKRGKLIGSGLHAEVHTCFLKENGVKRAVKIIRKDLLKNSNYLTRIDHEKEVLKLFDHPNILRLYEFFEDAKRIYIVREFCDGTELFREISLNETYTENKAARIMHQLFSVLNYIHSHQIVHSDLKPEHIFLNRLEIKLIDFSLAARKGTKQIKREGLWPYSSPELLSGVLDFPSDLWSCGVLLYILLCGVHPFHGTSDSAILENIKSIRVNKSGNTWEGISEGAKHLICQLLCDQSTRLSAEDALKHPWIVVLTQNDSPDTPIVQLALRNLREFRFTSLLADAVHTFITMQRVSNTDLKTMTEVFKKIDKNGDGRLSREELIEEYTGTMGIIQAENEVERIMKEVDSDKSGFIDYAEFVKAAMDTRKILSIENLRSAFRNFDKDSSGKISLSELRRVLSEKRLMDDGSWNTILQEFDDNGDGEIDLGEFERIVMTKVDSINSQ
jgi:calcium-dependent protein kinase